tara:strand:- start:786 stop:1058 length:273 start_codon:yes stop_codon:yes gene_type:complete
MDIIEKETPEEMEKRIAEQDALWNIFDEIWPKNAPPQVLDLNDEINSLQKVLVQQAMSDAKQNKTKAAELLTISRENLIYKLKKIEEESM